MESVGMALALCPLILNQLDNYVRGLQTVKLFRTRRYREHLERYATMLGGQHAILVNTMGRALGDAVSPGDLRDLLSSPGDISHKNPRLEDAMRGRLGCDYEVFAATMGQATTMLEELKNRLDWRPTNLLPWLPWNDPRVVVREARKVRDICSKSIYDDLFHSLDRANNVLRTLVDQSVEYQNPRRTRWSERSLSTHRAARAVADSVHKALTGSKIWGCSCRDKHLIRFTLDPKVDDASNTTDKLMFRIAITTEDSAGSAPMSFNYWHEVEVEPSCDRLKPGSNYPLFDMCSTLWRIDVGKGQREVMGCLSDEAYCHNLYLTKKAAGSLPSQTLEEAIMSSPSLPRNAPTVNRLVLSRRTRLQLAVKLAYSVLHFHGSWLRPRWSTRDIRLPGQSPEFQQPFLTWSIRDRQGESIRRSSSSVIRSETLFPLGLALIELSLCHTISALRIPEDESPEHEVTALKTAHRSLDHVYMESGARYGDVVQRCLFWSHSRDTGLDSEESQAAVFQYIVLPLFDDMRDFDRPSRPAVAN